MNYLDDGLRSLLTHVLDGVLVAQPVRALDRVEEVVLPAVDLRVAQSRIDSTLDTTRLEK